jgi:hypothetical protein
MVLHAYISSGDKQETHWWPQFKDIFSPFRHDDLDQFYDMPTIVSTLLLLRLVFIYLNNATLQCNRSLIIPNYVCGIVYAHGLCHSTTFCFMTVRARNGNL